MGGKELLANQKRSADESYVYKHTLDCHVNNELNILIYNMILTNGSTKKEHRQVNNAFKKMPVAREKKNNLSDAKKTRSKQDGYSQKKKLAKKKICICLITAS